MIIRILTIAFTLMACNCFGQDSITSFKQKLILTGEQNIHWFDSLKSLPLSQQINFIRERITLDTNVYVKHGMPDRIKINYDSIYKNKFAGCCKPLIIVSKPNMSFYYDDYYNRVNSVDIIRFIQALMEIKVDKISFFQGAQASALYGSIGQNGVIFLYVTDKRSIKLLKGCEKRSN